MNMITNKCISLRNIAVIALFSFFLALSVAFISVSLSREYYKTAPYHYDSSAYRTQALDVFDCLKEEGFTKALKLSLSTKDSLDITLRLLLLPAGLQHRYGHMLILFPLMLAFIAVTAVYVLKRTARLSLACLCPTALFVYPLFYHPYWGIADYWKENLATWMLGIAIVTWLLSDNMRKRPWAFACGLMLGLFAMQRTGIILFVGLLFLPLLISAVVQTTIKKDFHTAFWDAFTLIIPAAFMLDIVICFQAFDLYEYYAKGSYAYGSHSDIWKFILNGISSSWAKPKMDFFPGTYYSITTIPFILAPVFIFSATASRRRMSISSDAVKSLWFVIGLPMIMIAASTYYYGLFALWPILFTILLATLIPKQTTLKQSRIITILLIFAITSGSIIQYHVTTRNADEIAKRDGWYRTLMLTVADEITRSGNPQQPYAIFFNEVGAPLANHVRFDLKQKIGQPEIRLTFHDKNIIRRFSGLPAAQIVRTEMQRLESMQDPIVIAHADIGNLYQPANDPLASAFTKGLNLYVQNHSQWKVTRTIPSAWGPLNVYHYKKPDNAGKP